MNRLIHGGNIYSFARKLHLKPSDIIDFSSNINFVTPKVKLNIDVCPYPDPNYSRLKKAIAKKFNISASLIQLFNGASDAIFNILQRYKNAVLYAPIYLEYKRAQRIHMINRFENIYELPKKDALVVFANPATPDGTYYNLDDLFEIWYKQNNTVLIDESFLDFCSKKSAIDYIAQYDKLIILKSFSKFYACAGVRVGCTISKIKFDTPIWNISSFDENYILQALNDSKFSLKSTQVNEKNKKMLCEILKESNLFTTIFESCANFYLAKLKNLTAFSLQRKLSEFGILIRNCSNFDFLDESFVRFAVKSKKDLKILKKTLK
ncbi:L-threonine 3-O-phosphate decarboxylase [Desulfurella amilsii]|uniref:histidinol-phosphate transaminase n=1 Tax=Desulfurella amilsii TaxID=1562698 RepID=A0A1X4Y093_9BACT|nr:aminotransferase class I/II-fold pyridoxal phosphate-dependent enzyme [Desulfurella amilsii]OSS43173.1 L-threonine 3-O-phosphate decarboxylase [Desulfurella amilsii]